MTKNDCLPIPAMNINDSVVKVRAISIFLTTILITFIYLNFILRMKNGIILFTPIT